MLDAAMRTRVVGLAVGAAAGLGLIAFFMYREMRRRRRQRLMLETNPRPFDAAALLQGALDAQEAEAQQQALAAVEAAVQGLSPEQQMGIRNQLDQVLNCVSTLRSEVAELRGGLQDIAAQIIQDVKKGVDESQRGRRRRHFIHRERTDSNGSSSIYFTASQGVASTFEETSEGGYSTAYAESDYTDRDTDREEGERQPEQDSEEEEDQSCATVLTLRQEASQDEDEGPIDLDEHEEKAPLDLKEAPSVDLALLLAQSDILHTGSASLKAEGYRLLLENKTEYEDSREFLWRLARAYCDMYNSAQTKQERRSYAQKGLEEAEHALKKNGLNAECYKWFAQVSTLITQPESMHSKMKSGHILKEHLDRALALKDDPTCFFLLGRWCYQVATLDWLEKKAAAALYPCPPSADLHDALDNFLKAEELSPGSSKTVRLYIAKCHKELGNLPEATKWMKLAAMLPGNSHDEETALLEAELGFKNE